MTFKAGRQKEDWIYHKPAVVSSHGRNALETVDSGQKPSCSCFYSRRLNISSITKGSCLMRPFKVLFTFASPALWLTAHKVPCPLPSGGRSLRLNKRTPRIASQSSGPVQSRAASQSPHRHLRAQPPLQDASLLIISLCKTQLMCFSPPSLSTPPVSI